MSLYVGTSGWAYPEWRPGFYPAGMPQSRFLAHYASVLGACEINATHYKVQSPEAVARWAADVPDGFRFAAKAHRRLTHVRSLPPHAGGAAFLEGFLASLAPLGDRLGAVLFQFPPARERDDGALGEFLACLPPDLPFAVEFRHESWLDTVVEARIAEAGGTVCVGETTGAVLPRLPEGRLAYVRMRARALRARGPRRAGATCWSTRRPTAPSTPSRSTRGCPPGTPSRGWGSRSGWWAPGTDPGRTYAWPAGILVKIIFPEGLCRTLVTSTVTSCPTEPRPPSTTIIVPSWR